jgi:uncharacterized protein (TIGR00661 family)
LKNQFNISKVLIAPLDWGLGHATRCIPIIKAFKQLNITVVLAADGHQAALLLKEFPDLTILPLTGYRVHYAKSRLLLLFSLMLQIPKLYQTIKAEEAWLKKVVEENQIDLVVSDNRFGLHHPSVPSVFITHQLIIKAPYQLIEYIFRRINYYFINQFTTCWVPDMIANPGLAGKLSHPTIMPKVPVSYMKLLSRFTRVSCATKYTFGIVLSGPEPQRTILENKILIDLEAFTKPVVFIRGLPSEAAPLEVPAHVTVFNHLDTNDLATELQQADYIICRGGYTSLMELLSIDKKLIVVPTPGQTEQEYLSELLMSTKRLMRISQSEFSLEETYAKAQNFTYSKMNIDQFDVEQLKALLLNLPK